MRCLQRGPPLLHPTTECPGCPSYPVELASARISPDIRCCSAQLGDLASYVLENLEDALVSWLFSRCHVITPSRLRRWPREPATAEVTEAQLRRPEKKAGLAVDYLPVAGSPERRYERAANGLLRLIARHSLRVFTVYRLGLSGLLALLLATGALAAH